MIESRDLFTKMYENAEKYLGIVFELDEAFLLDG